MWLVLFTFNTTYDYSVDYKYKSTRVQVQEYLVFSMHTHAYATQLTVTELATVVCKWVPVWW